MNIIKIVSPQPLEPSEPTSVLLPLPKPAADSDSRFQSGGVVEWKAPHIDWNPWTRNSAYQVGGAYHALEPQERASQVSNNLYQEMNQRKVNDPGLCKVRLCVRMQDAFVCAYAGCICVCVCV